MNLLDSFSNKLNFKKYEQLEYLSDVKLKVYGKTIRELFENAAEGMFSLITDIGKIREIIKKQIEISFNEKMSKEDMLIVWLEKLLFLNEVNGLIFSDFTVTHFSNEAEKSNSKIKAIARGEKINFKKHEIFLQIKGPTYHNLNIQYDKKTNIFSVEIVFDV
ncbi:MAG: archease [Candidatus Humimicrobiaceae bacterium]